MTLECWTAGLRNIVGEVVHDAVFQSAIEENVAADVIDPVLLPALLSLVVDVVALARIRAVLAFPVFLYYAVFQDQLDLAVAGGNPALSGGDGPFAEPEIELAIFSAVGAGALVFPRLLDGLRKA